MNDNDRQLGKALGSVVDGQIDDAAEHLKGKVKEWSDGLCSGHIFPPLLAVALQHESIWPLLPICS